ncbi:FtsX-like permease family protein [Kitasatospora sp. NPDC101801]|uniref:FtsX-like permease family protein n=1 Tax=Kitasatospora sp. NPDC101801 TaxID=3364103 RepID=UPI003820F426
MSAPTLVRPPSTAPGDQVRSRLLAQFGLGARLALGSGREGWGRLLLTAAGVGLGVALLLFTASFPGIVEHRNHRLYLQNDTFEEGPAGPTGQSVLVADADTKFRDTPIRGRVVQPEGPQATVPPGLAAFPAPGRMAVSPALADLLDAPGNQLLRDRLPYPVTGTISPDGLLGPGQYAFVLGSSGLAVESGAHRITEYGHFSPAKPMDPRLVLLNVVGLMVMLAPVGVFLAAAARFGGERRDRRLAALRLAGADRRMTARLAAGESLTGSVLGLVAGVALFLIGRQLIEQLTVAGFSFYASDISPQPLIAVAVALVVPVLAIGVTLLAMRRVTVDPLGVVRHSGSDRRRLWWRLALLAVGLLVVGAAMALPSGYDPGRTDRDGLFNPVQDTRGSLLVSFGVLLMLAAVCTLLPWLVGAVIRRAGGGGLSWQLAVRRLQLGVGPAATAVTGVVVTVAGAIALQTLFVGVSQTYRPAEPDTSGYRFQHRVQFPTGAVAELTDRLGRSPGVAGAAGFVELNLTDPGGENWYGETVRIADCATLARFAALPGCKDGDAFASPIGDEPGMRFRDQPVAPGTQVRVNSVTGGGAAPLWTLPAVLAPAPRLSRVDPGIAYSGNLLLLTPGAVPPEVLNGQRRVVLVAMDPAAPEPLEQLTTDAMTISPQARTVSLFDNGQNHTYLAVKRVLTAGAGMTLLLVSLSLLVGQLERLREQRRILGVLYAFGTRRRVLALSVLWQTAIPMALGLVLAAAGGLLMGAVLQYTAGLDFSFDRSAMLTLSGVAGASVLLVTLLGLPLVLRLMRPGALRHE